MICGILFFLFFLKNTCNYACDAVEIIPRFRTTEDAKESNEKYYALVFTGLVERYEGYKAEEYEVRSEDGYHLLVHRISEAPTSPKAEGKPVVFLQHGILCSSETWVVFEPENALAYLLADAGYDVWFGNVRGNTNTRSHDKLSPDDLAFWDFSFHEMATKDVPAMIDFVLQESGQTHLTYIGHSMGTLISYIMLSEKPEYNEKIDLVISLAPIAFWKRETAAITLTSTYALIVIGAEGPEVCAQSIRNMEKFQLFCTGALSIFCLNAFRVIVGSNVEQVSDNRLQEAMSYFPAGTSLKNMHHFIQLMKSGQLRQFNYYNVMTNINHYKQMMPPTYNLSKITAPVILIYGRNDPLSMETNVHKLRQRLPNVVASEAVPSADFTHIDFLWAKDGKELLHDRVLALIELHKKR